MRKRALKNFAFLEFMTRLKSLRRRANRSVRFDQRCAWSGNAPKIRQVLRRFRFRLIELRRFNESMEQGQWPKASAMVFLMKTEHSVFGLLSTKKSSTLGRFAHLWVWWDQQHQPTSSWSEWRRKKKKERREPKRMKMAEKYKCHCSLGSKASAQPRHYFHLENELKDFVLCACCGLASFLRLASIRESVSSHWFDGPHFDAKTIINLRHLVLIVILSYG